MAHITGDEVERILSEATLAEGQYDRGMFMVLHLREMVDALKEKWYAEHDAARGA